MHLLPDVGKIPLADATLVEDPSEVQHEEENASVCSASTKGSTLSVTETVNAGNRDFKIIVEIKSGIRHTIHLVAPTIQDKEAWISDISQCLDNIHMHSLLSPGIGSSSGGKCCAHPNSVLNVLQTGLILFISDSRCFSFLCRTCNLGVAGKTMKDPSLQDIKRSELTRDCSRTTWTFDFPERSTHANYLRFVMRPRNDCCNG